MKFINSLRSMFRNAVGNGTEESSSNQSSNKENNGDQPSKENDAGQSAANTLEKPSFTLSNPMNSPLDNLFYCEGFLAALNEAHSYFAGNFLSTNLNPLNKGFAAQKAQFIAAYKYGYEDGGIYTARLLNTSGSNANKINTLESQIAIYQLKVVHYAVQIEKELNQQNNPIQAKPATN